MSAARFEDRVDLAAVLEHLPGAAEAGRDHEGITRTEARALPGGTLDHDPAPRHDAQLVLGVAHPPFAARRGPAPGEELLARVRVEVLHAELGGAGDEALGRWFGDLRFQGAVEPDDGAAHECATQVLVPGNSSAKMRRGLTCPRRPRLEPRRRPAHRSTPGVGPALATFTGAGSAARSSRTVTRRSSAYASRSPAALLDSAQPCASTMSRSRGNPACVSAVATAAARRAESA